MNTARSLAEPIPAVLSAAPETSGARAARWSESPWRLLFLIALPYWVAVSTVRIVSGELFAAGGDLAYKPALLGLTTEVRIVGHVLMLVVVLLAHRVALAIGWPARRRGLAVAQHLTVALVAAAASRPVFVLAMELTHVGKAYWPGVFMPAGRGAKLWAALGLEFAVIYFFGLALLAGALAWSALQRSELDRAKLHDAWTHARLQALRMQLNPHFLFNTFNMIATLLDAKPQPARARELLLAVSDLSRRTLMAAQREWMPLGEELALVECYLRIQAARFEGRLSYELVRASELEHAQVPALALQPLVENAVLHGVADSRQVLRVRVCAEVSADGGALCLCVVNETEGLLGTSRGAGIGLANVRTRLAACYGGRARLHAEPSGPGAYVARITIPLEGREMTPRATGPISRSFTT